MADPVQRPRFSIRGQYIKDLSFENPRAPQSLMSLEHKPKIDVSVNLKAQKLQEQFFELTMQLGARASVEDQPLFIAELSYAGIFELQDVPEGLTESVMLIECPFVLFPFARRVIADVTRDGGFPPLLLDPIDFQGLYAQNKAPKQ